MMYVLCYCSSFVTHINIKYIYSTYVIITKWCHIGTAMIRKSQLPTILIIKQSPFLHDCLLFVSAYCSEPYQWWTPVWHFRREKSICQMSLQTDRKRRQLHEWMWHMAVRVDPRLHSFFPAKYIHCAHSFFHNIKAFAAVFHSSPSNHSRCYHGGPIDN